MKSLSLRDISVRFGEVQALDRVEISLEAGQICMLVGPNGAGKSTLLKVLLGLVRPEQGELHIDQQMAVQDYAFREKIGYLPENVAFSENLTGWQVLSFFACARGVRKERIEEVLRFVSLEHAARRAVRGYSRGMRQRLGLAVAILTEPMLLILDEPTGGLDQEGLSVLWEVLRVWREAGRMVLLSTHDIALLERRVDQMCVFKRGRICARGTPLELREMAALPIQIYLTFDDEKVITRLRTLEVLSSWITEVEEKKEQGVFQVRLVIPSHALLDYVQQQSLFSSDIRGFRMEEPTLDEVYERLLEMF